MIVLRHFSFYHIDRVISLRNEFDFLISEYVVNHQRFLFQLISHESNFVKPEYKGGLFILSHNTGALSLKLGYIKTPVVLVSAQ